MTDGRSPEQPDHARRLPPPSRPLPPPSQPQGQPAAGQQAAGRPPLPPASNPAPQQPQVGAQQPQAAPQQHQHPQPGAQQYQHPQYANLQPPAKRRGRGLNIFLGIGAAICTIIVISVVATSIAGTRTGDRPELPETPPYYAVEDRPGFDELIAYRDELDAKWDAAAEDGTIYDYVPQTVNAAQYVQDFRFTLVDKIAEMGFGLSGSYDVGEVDAQIARYRAELAEIERKFLAGEPFGVQYTITRPDGTTITGDGETTPVAGAVDFARAFNPGPGADGTYADAMIELAAQFGLLVDWDFENIYQDCSREKDDTLMIAAYCMANNDRVFVNRAHGNYANMLRSPAFVDVMRHEIAHHEIGRICGTTAPPITQGLVEGVTNSYAVLALGADRGTLAKTSEGIAEYDMSQQTDDIAWEIFENENCG